MSIWVVSTDTINFDNRRLEESYIVTRHGVFIIGVNNNGAYYCEVQEEQYIRKASTVKNHHKFHQQLEVLESLDERIWKSPLHPM